MISTWPTRVAFVVDTNGGAPLRYRVQTPLSGLTELGIEVSVADAADPRLPARLRDVDAAVVFRAPATVELAASLNSTREQNPATLLAFDIDDALFDDVHSPADEAWQAMSSRYRASIALCGRFLGSTPTIAGLAQEQTGVPSVAVANRLHPELLELSRRARQQPRIPGPPRIALFDGSGTHGTSLERLAPVITEVIGRHRAHFWAFGAHSIPSSLGALGRSLHRVPFMDWRDLPVWMRQMDLILAPNSDSGVIADTKSPLKWLEASAVGVPTLAQATQPYRTTVRDGVDGVLVDGREPEAWIEPLEDLLVDPRRRRSIGRAAAIAVQEHDAVGAAQGLLAALTTLRLREPIDPPIALAGLPSGRVVQPLPTGIPERLKPPLGKRAVLRVLRGEPARRGSRRDAAT